ncbi:phage conserved hypothetical protein, phiE125 gp8 family [Loktanella atrilutea]|uniref:Phage gp6-like head-tail connector protein n=1 Tax=Loktanella atrilutea TaxID=366533 RepID=A0A1M5DKK8_LOKAT|nr:head-tail connector protein [Loktanella atrilutea]SHF67435.1 phage conserved hypothetical protein, phiE125 gp8 family [Loktanella atrilutea]
MLRPVRITPPDWAPIKVEEAKLFLRVDGAEEDALIEGLIAAAVDHLDGRSGILGRCMVTQVWRYQAQCLHAQFDFDMPGATAATVRFVDATGETQAVTLPNDRLVETVRGSSLIVSDADPLAAWRGPAMIDATFGTAVDDVPPALVQAVRMLVAHWYANREAVVTRSAAPLPLGVQMLIAPYRWMSV